MAVNETDIFVDTSWKLLHSYQIFVIFSAISAIRFLSLRCWQITRKQLLCAFRRREKWLTFRFALEFTWIRCLWTFRPNNVTKFAHNHTWVCPKLSVLVCFGFISPKSVFFSEFNSRNFQVFLCIPQKSRCFYAKTAPHVCALMKMTRKC